jgi:uncharacterized protein YceK
MFSKLASAVVFLPGLAGCSSISDVTSIREGIFTASASISLEIL